MKVHDRVILPFMLIDNCIVMNSNIEKGAERFGFLERFDVANVEKIECAIDVYDYIIG